MFSFYATCVKSCNILAKAVTFLSCCSLPPRQSSLALCGISKLGPQNICITVTSHKSGENHCMKPRLSWFHVYTAMLFSPETMCKPIMSTWNFRHDFAGAKWRAYHKTRKLQLPPSELQTISKSQLQMCPAVWAHKFHPSIGELKDTTKQSYQYNNLSSLVNRNLLHLKHYLTQVS